MAPMSSTPLVGGASPAHQAHQASKGPKLCVTCPASPAPAAAGCWQQPSTAAPALRLQPLLASSPAPTCNAGHAWKGHSLTSTPFSLRASHSSGLMTRVLKKDGSADLETELQAVAALLPLVRLLLAYWGCTGLVGPRCHCSEAALGRVVGAGKERTVHQGSYHPAAQASSFTMAAGSQSRKLRLTSCALQVAPYKLRLKYIPCLLFSHLLTLTSLRLP